MFEGKRVIGIGGFQLCGKDSLCKILLNKCSKLGYSAKRIALADALKQEIRPQLITKYGIDVLNCTPEQKEIVRPELIELGRERRLSSKGTFWTNIVYQQIKECNEQIIVVPDIRYNVYPEDEAVWVKKNRGTLVNVSRYSRTEKAGVMTNHRVYWQGNEEEQKNAHKVAAVADFFVEWATAPFEILEKETSDICDRIISHAIRL